MKIFALLNAGASRLYTQMMASFHQKRALHITLQNNQLKDLHREKFDRGSSSCCNQATLTTTRINKPEWPQSNRPMIRLHEWAAREPGNTSVAVVNRPWHKLPPESQVCLYLISFTGNRVPYSWPLLSTARAMMESKASRSSGYFATTALITAILSWKAILELLAFAFS